MQHSISRSIEDGKAIRSEPFFKKLHDMKKIYLVCMRALSINECAVLNRRKRSRPEKKNEKDWNRWKTTTITTTTKEKQANMNTMKDQNGVKKMKFRRILGKKRKVERLFVERNVREREYKKEKGETEGKKKERFKWTKNLIWRNVEIKG